MVSRRTQLSGRRINGNSVTLSEPLSWTGVHKPAGSEEPDESTLAVLEHLERVAQQYELYLRLARINDLPTLNELWDSPQFEAPSSDRPLGLVIDLATPMGLQLTKRS